MPCSDQQSGRPASIGLFVVRYGIGAVMVIAGIVPPPKPSQWRVPAGAVTPEDEQR